MVFCKQNIHQNLSFYKPISLQNLIFFKVFDSKILFSKNIALRNKLSRKLLKRQFLHFSGVKWPKKWFFFILKSKSPKKWFFKTSFTWKSVALLKFVIKIWRVVKRMFQNPTRCKVSDSKNEELCKNWIKIWLILKIFIQNLRSC